MTNFSRDALKMFSEPWSSAFDDHQLERDRVDQLISRLKEVLAQDRTVLCRVVQSESRTTGTGELEYIHRKEHVKLTIEVEWDEWHAVPKRGNET